jgi:hypothetical protein
MIFIITKLYLGFVIGKNFYNNNNKLNFYYNYAENIKTFINYNKYF